MRSQDGWISIVIPKIRPTLNALPTGVTLREPEAAAKWGGERPPGEAAGGEDSEAEEGGAPEVAAKDVAGPVGADDHTGRAGEEDQSDTQNADRMAQVAPEERGGEHGDNPEDEHIAVDVTAREAVAGKVGGDAEVVV